MRQIGMRFDAITLNQQDPIDSMSQKEIGRWKIRRETDRAIVKLVGLYLRLIAMPLCVEQERRWRIAR